MGRKSRIKTVQQSFIGGEISPQLLGRIDTEMYFKSAAKLENVYVNPQGHITRREGLEYIATTTASAACRLVSFEFNTDQTYLLVFTPGEFKVYKDDVLQATITSSPVSTLTAAQIQEMRYTQSADTLILVHPDVQPIKITRTSHTVWTNVSITFTNIPVFPFSGVTLSEPAAIISTLSSVSGRDVEVTASASVFTSGHVDQYIISKTGGILFIKEYVSGTVVKGDVRVTFPSLGPIPSGDWELETGHEAVWSATQGWPVSLTFFQGRLWFGGSKNRPQTIWGSKSGSFFDFTVGSAEADEALDLTIDDDRVNAIRNLVAGRNLQVFTSGGEFYFSAGANQPLTPTTVSLTKATSHGVNSVKPVSLDGATIFIEESGSSVREFVFNDLEQSYNSKDISLLSSHLVNTPVRMAVRQSTSLSPANFMYLVNGDGTMAVLSFLRASELVAWSQFTTTGTFEQLAIVDDVVYVAVKRSINGGDVRYVEKLNAAHFMDASTKTTAGAPTASWSGLSHLEAETVKVRGDGYILQDATVASGAFTSSDEATTLEAGVNYAATITTLPIDANLGGVTLTASWRRVVWSSIRLYESRNIVVKFGSKTFKPHFREFGSATLDAPIADFTGWKKVYLTGLGRDPAITVTQEEPLEFNVLSLEIAVK